jgi:uncharacterized protein YjbI with pentapeptide repeats
VIAARIAVVLLAFGAVLGGQPAYAQLPTLKYFNSFTVTGNYSVCGVDLRPQSQVNGFVTGTIQFGQGNCAAVPQDADIVAAYLYWETIWANPADLEGALFRGQPVTAVKSTAIPLVGPYSPCWSNGGDNLTMLRADVLRLLPPQLDESGKPTGKRLVNHSDLAQYAVQYPNGSWPFTVTLPERGTGNQLPQSAGATLVLVWRKPTEPLRTVVINDGMQIQSPGESTLFTIPGFLQSATGDAQITHIVGSGAPNDGDRIWFNNSTTPIGVNRFVRTSGGASDRAWSNPTISVSTLMPGTDGGNFGEQVTTRVDHVSTSPYDCISWAAIVFSTTVDDVDGDGLVSKLEDTSGLVNPANQPYPDLHAMGATSTHKDLFVEVARMVAGATAYGFPAGHPFNPAFPRVTTTGHDHMLSMPAVKLAIDAYRNAPVPNPDGVNGINVHFDLGPTVGAAYKSAFQASGDPAANHIVVGSLARGGEAIAEVAPCPVTAPNADGTPKNCRFEYFPGTVAWPTPFQLYAQSPVGNNGEELTAAQANACDDSGVNTCRQRFDVNRQGLFHFVMYVHTRALSRSAYPCLDTSVPPKPVPFNDQSACDVAPNPEYYIPRSVSGVGELPGRYVMVSLGQWDNFVGSDYMQAATTVHELGHNLNLGHGGKAATYTTLANGRGRVTIEPNCKPPYFSIMSYLYQAAGLRADDGVPRVDLSSGVFGLTQGKIDENNVFDALLTPAAPYRASWFALLTPGTLGATLGLPAAKKHCDGTLLQSGEPGTVPGEPGVARLDAVTVSSLLDWRGDAGTTTSGPQDVNFDGTLTDLNGFNDWSAVLLNQVGSGRNMAGMSLGMNWGGVDWNGVDWNGVDWNGVDWNGVDWNGVDWDGVDWNGVDWNGVDWNGVDWNGVDWNGVDWNGVDWNGVDWNGVDWNGVAKGVPLDRPTALEAGGATAPNAMKAFVRGTNGAGGSNSSAPVGQTWVPNGEPTTCNTLTPDACHQVRLDWSPSNVGPASSFRVSRVWDQTGAAVAPGAGSTIQVVGTTNAATTTLNDAEELPHAQRFIYFSQATIDGLLRSTSNFAIITSVNAAPVANNDSFNTTTTGQRTASGNVLSNDTDQDSPSSRLRAVLVAGPTNGTLVFNADGTFVYTPNSGFSTGTDTFTYKANNGTWSGDPSITMSPDSNIATVTINVRRGGGGR